MSRKPTINATPTHGELIRYKLPGDDRWFEVSLRTGRVSVSDYNPWRAAARLADALADAEAEGRERERELSREARRRHEESHR